MSTSVIARFPMTEGMGAALIDTLRTALADTRAFEGCESIEVYTDNDNADTIVLWEKFATRANHEAYLAWRVETGMLEQLGPIMAGDLEITYLDGHPDV